MLTHERLCELLHYSPYDGTWTWIKPTHKGRPQVGTIAGTIAHICGKSYRYIGIDNQRYKAARLAIFYMTKKWPESEVTFRDFNSLNDTYTNLRQASRSQTIAGSKLRVDNTSGFKGVSFNERIGRYEAYIKQNYRKLHLGWFKDPKVAHEKVAKAGKQLFGDFARAS